MPISIVNIDILDSNSDAIILTADGAKKGMEGNIARAFAKKYPNAWELLGYEVIYPIPLGVTKIYSIEDDDDSIFRFCIIASTLHHLEVLEKSDKLNIINSALRYALTQASNKHLKSICTTILKGGWRLEAEEAFVQMVLTYKSFASAHLSLPNLEICVKEPKEFSDIAKVVSRRFVDDVIVIT
jgi:O-acetyl-ADP-ribose deacetylase (regulator of RNase III)